MVWIGPRRFPHRPYLEAWRALNPDWNLVLWTEELLASEALISQPIIDQIGHIAGKVNLIRLELLARYGGVYVDADTEPLRPLSELAVPEWADSWAMTSRNNWVQNAIMACEEGHPVITEFVASAPATLERLRGRRVQFTEVYGAHYITKPLRAHEGFWEPDRGRRWGSRQVFQDRGEGDTTTAIAVHDCDRSWRRELGGSKARL